MEQALTFNTVKLNSFLCVIEPLSTQILCSKLDNLFLPWTRTQTLTDLIEANIVDTSCWGLPILVSELFTSPY